MDNSDIEDIEGITGPLRRLPDALGYGPDQTLTLPRESVEFLIRHAADEIDYVHREEIRRARQEVEDRYHVDKLLTLTGLRVIYARRDHGTLLIELENYAGQRFQFSTSRYFYGIDPSKLIGKEFDLKFGYVEHKEDA